MIAQKHQKVELQAVRREVVGRKVRHLRAEGMIPAVLYGKGQEPISLQVPVGEFGRVMKEAGESTLVYLTVDGETYPTIIHDISLDPVGDTYLHADFYKVNLKEKIEAEIPVVFEGESPAVKNLGGIFVRNINELTVEALPTDLPHELTVDISALAELGAQLTVKDVKLPAGVTTPANPDEVIALIQEPMSEEELKESLEGEQTSVEDVEQVKKEKEEGEEGEEAPATPGAPAKEE